MTSFKVDGTFYSHAKAFRAGNAALGLWVRSGAYCAQHRTKGFMPVEVVRLLGTTRQAKRLVAVELWTDAEHGYQFHQWTTHQREQRPHIPEAVRYFVYERDGHQCVLCGATSPLSLDHIWPWLLGGTDDPENLQTLCIPCNSRKGARVAQ